MQDECILLAPNRYKLARNGDEMLRFAILYGYWFFFFCFFLHSRNIQLHHWRARRMHLTSKQNDVYNIRMPIVSDIIHIQL